MIAWLGLGSNLQNPSCQLKTALEKLKSLDNTRIMKCSSFYRTPPWGDEQQDDFVNAVVEIETDLEPVSLLRELQSVENSMGRLRTGRRWGPRLIDLDLLMYGELQLHIAELEIPHPRMHERAFVLVPLCELDEMVHIPGKGRASELLESLESVNIHLLDEQAVE